MLSPALDHLGIHERRRIAAANPSAFGPPVQHVIRNVATCARLRARFARDVVEDLLGLGVLVAIAAIVFLLVTSLRAAVGVLLLDAALALLIANLRAYLGRR